METEESPPAIILLMHHFLGYCSNAVVPELYLDERIYNTPGVSDIIIDYFLPRTQNLEISRKSTRNYYTQQFKPRLLKFLLNQCSGHLESLTLQDLEEKYDYSETNENSDEGDILREIERHECMDKLQIHESESRLHPKMLVLDCYTEDDELNPLWSWLWKRCGSLEKLDLKSITEEVDHLAEEISNHMPNLCKIQFGLEKEGQRSLKDQYLSKIISSCHTGWKSVEIRPSAEFHKASKSALVKYYSTIEDLFVASVKYSSEELRLLLSSAPNFQTLITITDGEYMYGPIPQIDSSMFIDQDPDTGLLRPWACESSLKELRVRIGGISDGENEEAQHVQHQVYERLSRFTKLEKLWLGGNPHPYDDYDGDDSNEWGLYDFQHDGLVMSLRSGLDKLKGLKELRVLSVSRMFTEIGLEEIKWMVEHWPKLCVIRGIRSQNEGDFEFIDEKALIKDWLKTNRPRIQLLESEKWIKFKG
ncbi:hypothetical protein BGZ46_009863 [Entomortierella lignicola]|nr:hypothetical protein BGZ46_009863 [Entomortierella lignicola]